MNEVRAFKKIEEQKVQKIATSKSISRIQSRSASITPTKHIDKSS